jgi:serine phosphatase RsbU (regulator of sigma subunit)/anti-sigma regulatory factor (Ser/Thr protein kinase)
VTSMLDRMTLPSGAEGGRTLRRRRSRSDGASVPQRPSALPEPGASASPLDIDPSDPLLHFLLSATGPVDVNALPAYSAAVRRMKEDGVHLVLPLVASGELVGVVALGERRSERAYSRDDKKLLESLARFAAPALRLGELVRQRGQEARNLQRIESELQVAQAIQHQFLPSALPSMEGWQVAAFYRPARTVGGDFYDVIELPDGRVMLVVGDVTDKGVPAALVMASTHALLRSTAVVNCSPGQVLARVNDLLHPQIPVHMFVTCLVLVIDVATGRTEFANAGHNLPYVRRGAELIALEARGMPLGLMPGSAYEEHVTQIEPGDLLLLYSDGITEQHDSSGEMFGFGRTQQLVAGADSAEGLVDAAVSALTGFADEAELEDDVTLVAIQRGIGAAVAGPVQIEAFDVVSSPGNERAVMDRVAGAVADVLSGPRLDALKTAVSEAAMNAIEHGNLSNPEALVGVSVLRSADRVVVEIRDLGNGRDADVEIPDLDLKIQGLQTPRGWGMFLIQQLVDEVEEQTDHAGHAVRLVMYREGGAR